MRAAVTVWQGRISPVLEEARTLIVVEYGEGHARQVSSLRLDRPGLAEEPALWRCLGIDTLVCGAACRWTLQRLRQDGLTVLSPVTGNAQEVLKSLGEGNLQLSRSDSCCRKLRLRRASLEPK